MIIEMIDMLYKQMIIEMIDMLYKQMIIEMIDMLYKQMIIEMIDMLYKQMIIEMIDTLYKQMIIEMIDMLYKQTIIEMIDMLHNQSHCTGFTQTQVTAYEQAMHSSFQIHSPVHVINPNVSNTERLEAHLHHTDKPRNERDVKHWQPTVSIDSSKAPHNFRTIKHSLHTQVQGSTLQLFQSLLNDLNSQRRLCVKLLWKTETPQVSRRAEPEGAVGESSGLV